MSYRLPLPVWAPYRTPGIPQEYLTQSQIEVKYGFTQNTIRHWLYPVGSGCKKTGRGPNDKLKFRMWYGKKIIKETDLIKWIGKSKPHGRRHVRAIETANEK